MDGQKNSNSKKWNYVSADSRFNELIKHPAFTGFSQLLLPWDDYQYPMESKLNTLPRFLPYHTNLKMEPIIGALNRMIDDCQSGLSVCYPIYSEAEMEKTPSLRHTGLFFLRGKANNPFAVIAPGGGFEYIGSLHEGFPYAKQISELGYNAFVIKYRTGMGQTIATRDMAKAIEFIITHANELGVSSYGYSVWGSSAGARMAASIGSDGPGKYGAFIYDKPTTVVMAYTGHQYVSAQEPATFVVVGENDGIAPPFIMKQRVNKLLKMGVDVEFHEYADVSHGFGVGERTSAEGWIDKAAAFWSNHSD